LVRRLSRVLGASLNPKVQAFSVNPFADPARMMRALRVALDSFFADNVAMAKLSSLSEVLDLSVRETIARAGAFEALVHERRFELMFQSVVLVAENSINHHEVLVRFGQDRCPFAMICMAKELDIIESLDRAAVKRPLADTTGKLRLAVNVSGRAILSGGFLKMI
jgi:predicted signal transduction protein with EAL and GGDEF domain